MEKIGHRGAPGFPRIGENTMHSFHEAFRRGADAIECDARETACGKLVVIHDATLDRTTNFCDLTRESKQSENRIARLSISEILLFDAGFGNHIPPLSEVLQVCAGREKKYVHIELKVRGIAGSVKELVSLFRCEERVCVSCFDSDDARERADGDPAPPSWSELELFRPLIKTALIASAQKLARCECGFLCDAARTVGARALHVEHTALTAKNVALFHAHRYAVRAWTVNEKADIDRCRQLGVDGMISDFPERL